MQGAHLLARRGGEKRGLWRIGSNGAGTWTRIDAAAVRFRPLLRAGPLREEIVCRRTFDNYTGEELGEPMTNYATAKLLNEPLPDPVPRPVRTVFYFDRTSVAVPPECREVMPD